MPTEESLECKETKIEVLDRPTPRTRNVRKITIQRTEGIVGDGLELSFIGPKGAVITRINLRFLDAVRFERIIVNAVQEGLKDIISALTKDNKEEQAWKWIRP